MLANARRIPFVEKDFENFHNSSPAIFFLNTKTSSSNSSASGEYPIIKFLT